MLYRIIRRLASCWDALVSRISYYSVRSAGVQVGENVKFVGVPLISMSKGSQVTIGDNTILRSISRGNAIGINHRITLTTLSPNAHIKIGRHVGMSGGAICCKDQVEIGDYTLLGANTIIADNDMHPVSPENRRSNFNDEDIPAKDVTIGENVWIGADVFICKGVSIGDNTVIGAKSLVSKSIPENCVAAGNPAKVIR